MVRQNGLGPRDAGHCRRWAVISSSIRFPRVSALALIVAAAFACSSSGGGSGSGGGSDSGASSGGSSGGSGSGSGSGGGDAGGSCSSGCNDGFSCTVDACVAGACKHSIGPNSGATACPAGQYCTVEKGCVASPACASVTDCQNAWKGDACKTNIQCDPASSVCTFDVLDKDKDGYPPQVCSGGDCDDSDPSIHPGATITCDGKDDACTGVVDQEPQADQWCLATDPTKSCQNGTCQCNPKNLCPTGSGKTACIDLSGDSINCGACGHACAQGESCMGGTCTCTASSCPVDQCIAECTREVTYSCYTPTMSECLAACHVARNGYSGNCLNLFDARQQCELDNSSVATWRCADCSGQSCVSCTSGPTCGLLQAPSTACNLVRAEFTAANCMPTCTGGTTLCAPACVDTTADPLNCGSCYNTCLSGQTCTAGMCK